MRSRIDILLVEDSPADVRLTEEELRDSGLDYSLDVVFNGEEAMDYLQKHKSDPNMRLPDVILLDLNMPRKNGHEVLAEISQDPVLVNIPVVLLTVSRSDHDVLEALRLKMNYYLNKPVSAEQLRVLLKAIFELMSEESAISAGESSINEDEHVCSILACNPHTSPAVLAKLAESRYSRIRSCVAENPHTSYEVLAKLSSDADPDVRISVAENPRAPQDLLEKLAQDENDDVRLVVAQNPNIPEPILNRLTEDTNIFIATAANKTLAL
jgi:CheY-like chemotaxis protein